MKKTTLAIITVLLLLCMCLPVGFEQPPVVNDITSQTSARNDDTNQQPGENQTATDLCQDLPPEHETTEGVWICDPDGKIVDAEGNVIGWQWHGDELPITPVECDEKPTEEQLAVTNFADTMNKRPVVLISNLLTIESDFSGIDTEVEDTEQKKIVWEGFHFGHTDIKDVSESSEDTGFENTEFEGQSGIRVEYEMRYVDNVTEETSVTNNISWEFIIFPERVEISSPGSNQVQGDFYTLMASKLVGTVNHQWSVEGVQIATENSRIHIVPSHDLKSEDAIGLGIYFYSMGGAPTSVAYVDGDAGIVVEQDMGETEGLANMTWGRPGAQWSIANEMRFVFNEVEDNSTTDNQTLDGIEYELTEINIIERKGCTLSVPELTPSFDDEDADGVIDAWDDCENTTAGVATDSKGCDVKAVIDANNTPGFTLIAVLTMSVGAAMLLGRQRIYD